MTSPYVVLGVANTADDAEIKSAFRKLAKKYHPDVNQGDASAEAKFKEINDAYETLKDPQKRAAFDYMAKPRAGPAAGGTYTNADWDAAFNRRRQYGQHDIDIEELLRRARAGESTNFVQKNKDTILNYKLTFAEAFTGKEVELRYTTGSGRSRTTKVVIPRSVSHGQKVRVAGQGDDALANTPAGDLYVTIAVEADQRFLRNDTTVITTVYIDFIEAMIGTNKRVPCVDGSEINLRIHAGMNPGASIKVPEKGFYDPMGKRGPMMVEVVMEQPKLNEAQYAALAKIKDL